ncbi:dUTP diphosphatase, partial [Saccharothrix sp. MB29]|nr:dUTP diphosphatase [Saccharothrix sp. MB29]
MPSVEVLLSRLDPAVPPPAYARPGDAGADLVTTTDVVIEPGERAVVGTGVAIALPEGYAGFVHPRSGLAARVGLSVVNTPGTIDAGYRGEIKVCLVNHDLREPVRLARG